MKRTIYFYERGNVAPLALAATAFVAVVSIFGLSVIPEGDAPDASITIEPNDKIVSVGDLFEIEVVVESSVPTNVFAGEIHFDPEIIAIIGIDYNTSIADLWAETPWYSNGKGTLIFGGGTTMEGGFQDKGSLIKVTFRALQEGDGQVSLKKPRILRHDGFGTNVKLTESPDTIFFVSEEKEEENNLVLKAESRTSYRIGENIPTTDLNGDGKQSIADISIFMLNLTGDDSRYDFNIDGEVDIKDLNILLSSN